MVGSRFLTIEKGIYKQEEEANGLELDISLWTDIWFNVDING